MALKPEHLDFKREIKERGIEHLVHFTPTINLLSMFEQGKVMSRALLEEFDIGDTLDFIEFLDSIRFDDKNYINLSISSPNSFLFNRFRERTQAMSHMNWCVLKIDTKYIYQNDTLFSVTNAANNHNKRVVGVTGDLEKFRMLFSPNVKVVTSYNSRTIQRQNLKAKYPTDEQAEVLVRDEIPIKDIMQVCFYDESELASAKAALNQYDTGNFVVDQSMFVKSRM
ncbi:MAG: DUF4433 domain-containing protein [Flavobacterium psychrophilum]|nr:MAG: DUF4433 domain-containing protein [Flavobacterium psychrophilum]